MKLGLYFWGGCFITHKAFGMSYYQLSSISRGCMMKEYSSNPWLAEDSALMTLDQLSAYLRVDPQTITRLVRAGKIPCYQVGRQLRFLRSEVLRTLNSSATPTTDTPRPAEPRGAIITRRRKLGPRPKVRSIDEHPSRR